MTTHKYNSNLSVALVLIATAFGISFGTSTVVQAAVITPSSVVASHTFAHANAVADNLINGNGFTASVPIETSTHSNTVWSAGPDGWFTDQANIGAPLTLDFDLGGTFTVGEAHIWNWNGSDSYSETQSGGWNTGDITLTFSNNAIFGDAGDTTQSLPTLSNATGLNDYTGEHFNVGPVAGVTHIRMTIDSIGGATNNVFVGLAEVRFSTAAAPTPAPEPSTLVLAALGLVGLAVRRRRRR